MRKCYTKIWLDDDLNQMGCLFEHCDEYFYKLYKHHINISKFITTFMNSTCRRYMEGGFSQLLSISAKELMEKYIDVDLEGDYSMFISDKNESRNYAYNQRLWVAWYYVYLHWYLKVSSKDILRVQPFDHCLNLYRCGHQMSFEAVIERVMWSFRCKGIKINERSLHDDEYLALVKLDKYGNKLVE